jgi:hypothetical protein
VTPGPREAFAGIDVAVARSKRLPVCVCVREGGALVPLPLARAGVRPPLGIGNVATALDDAATVAFAAAAAVYLRAVERDFGVVVRRIAIDAPRGPAPDGGRRVSELGLGARGIPYYVTPDAAGWERVRERVRRHLAGGGETGRLPHANQLWMLAGFALFEQLLQRWECLEVFPHAIGLVLGAAGQRKLTPGGLDARLAAVAGRTRWPMPPDAAALDGVAFGARHDKLDAYLCAWVASLGEEDCEAVGGPPDDTIWLPAPAAAGDSHAPAGGGSSEL